MSGEESRKAETAPPPLPPPPPQPHTDTQSKLGEAPSLSHASWKRGRAAFYFLGIFREEAWLLSLVFHLYQVYFRVPKPRALGRAS